jgi:thiol-disulfide isomerase/thioredoxin
MSARSVSRSLKRMSRENVAIYVLLAVLVILVVYFVMKNREGFNSDRQPVIVIYFFYADWCPHCVKAKPIVEQVQQQHANNNKLEFRSIDCEAPENKELVSQNNVTGFPTIKTADGTEMNSAVTVENFNNFIKQLTGN